MSVIENSYAGSSDAVIDGSRTVKRLEQAGYDGVLSVECGTEAEAVRSLAHMKSVIEAAGAVSV